MASVDTRNPDRNAHLKSVDFFDVDNYPTMTFVTRSIEADGDDYRVTGDLTIKGQTHPLELRYEHGGDLQDPFGNRQGRRLSVGHDQAKRMRPHLERPARQRRLAGERRRDPRDRPPGRGVQGGGRARDGSRVGDRQLGSAPLPRHAGLSAGNGWGASSIACSRRLTLLPGGG
jgi:hypothetical protein